MAEKQEPCKPGGADQKPLESSRGDKKGPFEVPWQLISPEHASRIGGALWVFLWLWRETDAEGDVRGGRSVQVGEMARDLGMAKRTVERHLATLRAEAYLETWPEQRGFSAWLVLGKSGGEAGQDEQEGARDCPAGQGPKEQEIEQNIPWSARNGGPEENHASTAKSGGPGVTKVADQAFGSAKNGGPATPPGPPLKGIKSISRLRRGEVLSNSPPCEFKEPTTTNVLPIDRGRRGARELDAAAVDAGGPRTLPPSPTMQAIEKGLARIPKWERPELTRTLLEALLKLAPYQIEHAFERAWAAHRTRRKDLSNPAGWWATMLTSWVKQWEQIRANEARHENDE